MAGSKKRTRDERIVKLDGRSVAARCIREARNGYMAMCPQPVSPIDASLCERLAWLECHLAMLNAKALGDKLTKEDSRLVIAYGGQHARLLKTLKATRAKRPAGPSLAELFPGREAVA